MERHADAVCSRGDDIPNVGFGLGLFDRAVQVRLSGGFGCDVEFRVVSLE
jgi:hypothetical protein